LIDYRQIPESSVAQGQTQCNGCGACCRIAPCLLLPADIRRLCQGLGVSRRELSHKLQVERTPQGQWQVRMRNPCAYLQGNECAVHDFKPTGGRDFKCWSSNQKRYFWSESDLRLIHFKPPAGELL